MKTGQNRVDIFYILNNFRNINLTKYILYIYIYFIKGKVLYCVFFSYIFKQKEIYILLLLMAGCLLRLACMCRIYITQNTQNDQTQTNPPNRSMKIRQFHHL